MQTKNDDMKGKCSTWLQSKSLGDCCMSAGLGRQCRALTNNPASSLRRPRTQASKTSNNSSFFLHICSCGARIFQMKGWAKKFSLSLETEGKQTLGRDIAGFCWDIPRACDKFAKKTCVHFMVPAVHMAVGKEKPERSS